MMEALRTLLNNLEDIGAASPELYDTDVKEQVGTVLIEVLFHMNSNYKLPESFGMFSESANLRVHAALQEFSKQCKGITLDVKSKLDLLGPDGIITKNGQYSECFFGEITEDCVYPESSVEKRHWLDSPIAFVTFLGMPGVLLLLASYLMVPALMENRVGSALAFIGAACISLIGGNYLWQYCADKTFRKKNSRQQA